MLHRNVIKFNSSLKRRKGNDNLNALRNVISVFISNRGNVVGLVQKLKFCTCMVDVGFILNFVFNLH